MISGLHQTIQTYRVRSCVGFRLTLRKGKTSGISEDVLTSPWMKSSSDGPRSVCIMFSYRLLEKFTEIKLSIQSRNKSEEDVWQVRSLKNSRIWKRGQAFIGIPSEFRVSIESGHNYTRKMLLV